MADATEGTVCQSCGMPINAEDWPEGSERGEFCQFCMVHDAFVADKDEVIKRLADMIEKDSGKSREDSEKEAEETLSTLKRWQ